MKTCSQCGLYKPLQEFYKNSRAKDGYRAECIPCHKARLKETGYESQYKWNRANVDKVRESARRRRKANPERYRTKEANRRTQKQLSLEDRQISTEYRKAIRNDPCFYCGEKIEEMHDDHFIPLAKGGTDDWFNLRRTCWVCNAAKGAQDVNTFLNEMSKEDRAKITRARTPIVKTSLDETHLCKAGLHEMTTENIATRQCKQCKIQRQRERRAKARLT